MKAAGMKNRGRSGSNSTTTTTTRLRLPSQAKQVQSMLPVGAAVRGVRNQARPLGR
jgi:hypothetical protein